jgi:preprotein translocase subunit SecB
MEALFTPTPSPLQLDRYFLKSLRFELREGFDHERIKSADINIPPLEIGVVSAEQNPNNPMRWQFEVSVELPDLPEYNSPYSIETTLVGFFTVDMDFPAELAERLARTNGPALLYSCAREIVASITGRSPYPRLLIPSVTFFQPQARQAELAENQVKQLGTADLDERGETKGIET